MSFMHIVDGAHIDHRAVGQICRFERRQGSRTEWRGTTSFEHFAFTDAELQKKISVGDVLYYPTSCPPNDDEAPVSKIHGRRPATKQDEEEAMRKLRYVLAVHRHARGGRATPAIISSAIGEVYEDEGRHWKRLRGNRAGRPVGKPSIKSVQRWLVVASPKPKLKNLVPRHRFKGRYDDRIDPAVREIIAELVETDFLRRPPISLDMLRDLIHARVRDYNTHHGTDHQLPGLSAIQTSIDAYPRDVVLKARYGAMASFITYGSAEAQPDPTHPLDRVELDSTVADLFVVCERTGLPLGRPTIVLVHDRCTRMPLAWLVTFEKPSILTVLQSLRMAMLPKDYVDEMVAEHGWEINHRSVTFGVPTVLVVDRGLENISEHIAKFCVRAGINQLHIMGGKKPWLKGCIEASIRSVSERLLHPAPGTTFHNTLMRMDYRSERDAVITLSDLNYALHLYFIDVYPREPRRSLNNARAIDVWNKLTRRHPVDSVTDVADLDHMLGLTLEAVPGRHGINCQGMQYFSSELVEMRSNPAFANAVADRGGKIEFYLNPADLGQIRVKLPHRDETIVVPVAPKWREYASGLSLYAHRTIRRYTIAEARNANVVDDLLASKVRLLEIMRGEFLSRRRTVRVGQRLARIEGVGRVAQAGTSASTTVRNSPAHDSGRRKTPTAVNDGIDLPIAAASAVVTPLVPRAAPTPMRKKKGFRP